MNATIVSNLASGNPQKIVKRAIAKLVVEGIPPDVVFNRGTLIATSTTSIDRLTITAGTSIAGTVNGSTIVNGDTLVLDGSGNVSLSNQQNVANVDTMFTQRRVTIFGDHARLDSVRRTRAVVERLIVGSPSGSLHDAPGNVRSNRPVQRRAIFNLSTVSRNAPADTKLEIQGAIHSLER